MPIMTTKLTLSSVRLWQGLNLALHLLLTAIISIGFLMTEGPFDKDPIFFIKLGFWFFSAAFFTLALFSDIPDREDIGIGEGGISRGKRISICMTKIFAWFSLLVDISLFSLITVSGIGEQGFLEGSLICFLVFSYFSLPKIFALLYLRKLQKEQPFVD